MDSVLDVDEMHDFRPGDDSLRGSTRFIKTVRDVAIYVAPIPDMGRGVLTVRFTKPESMSLESMAEKFEDFVRQSPIFQRLDSSIATEYEQNCASLTRLAPDGYVGLYECGAESTNQYMLIVQSYDVCGATKFQMDTIERVRNCVDKATDQVQKEAKLCRNSSRKRTMGRESYVDAIQRGDVNRRFIAAATFAAIGIKVTTEIETVKGIHEKFNIMHTIGTGFREYLTVFLAPEGPKYMRIYNWAYQYVDGLEGAPWHMCFHEGVRVYRGAESIKESLKDKHMAGMAMGSPHVNRQTATPPLIGHIASQIQKIVLWNCPISVMIAADPDLRMETQAAIEQFETAYSLLILRVQLWRTIRVALYPIDESQLGLRDHVMYGQKETITVPYYAVPEVSEMWAALMTFQERRLQIAYRLGRMSDLMPRDFSLPTFKDLFSEERDDSTTFVLERGILENMFVVHDAVVRVNNYFQNGVVPRGEFVHETILRETALVELPKPDIEGSTNFGNDMDNARLSDLDTSEVSEIDLDALRGLRQASRGKRNARLRRGNHPPAIAHKPQNHNSNIESDSDYADLAVESAVDDDR